MKILVVDSNIVFANKVKEFLIKYMKECEVDIAQNALVMRRRLERKKYNLILVDVIATIDSELMLKELNKTDTPKITWTMVAAGQKIEVVNNFLNSKTFNKPVNDDEFNTLVGAIGSLQECT